MNLPQGSQSTAPSPRAGRGRQLKICHIAATAEGATWMVEQLQRLRDDWGFDVTAVISGDRGGLPDRLRAENIPFHVANFDAGVGAPGAMFQMPLTVLRLARFFRRERFDVVQSHIFKSMTVGRPAAWIADVPVRLAMIAGPFHLEAYSSRWIERLTYRMETQLIPSCEKSLSLCRELGIPERVLAPVIYYSPDPSNFDPLKITGVGIREQFGWPEKTPVICQVAYFYPRLPSGKWIPEPLHGRGVKGHGDLIRAMPAVLREFHDAKLVLVGVGWTEHGKKYMTEMQELVTSLNLDSTVVFTGFRADANRILTEVDVAVQPSLSENLGGAIEALLLARPTVVTNVGGLVDAVRDQQTGIVVRPSDPTDLARGIIELLHKPERARALGQAGRQLMLQQFTLDRTVSDLAGLYQQLVAERAQRFAYNPVRSLLRVVIAAPVFTYMILRLVAWDIYVPIYLARCRAVPIRVFYLGVRFYCRLARAYSFASRVAYLALAGAKRLAGRLASSVARLAKSHE